MKRSQVAALQRLLEGEETLNGDARPETRALASLAAVLESHAVAPQPEFKADLRAQLVEQARSLPARPPLLTRLRDLIDRSTERWRYSARVAMASAAGAVALSTGGVAVAAEHALPGDLLYPVKLVLEDARTFFVRDEVARGERYLALATERVEEAAILAAAGDQEGAAEALRLADRLVRTGAGDLIHTFQETTDRAIVEGLLAWTGRIREGLAAFADVLEGAAADAAADLRTTLDRIDQRLDAVTGGCAACLPAAEGEEDGQVSDHDSMVWVVPGGGAFDFGYIPPADEPFDPCPCVPLTVPDATGSLPPAPDPAEQTPPTPEPDAGDGDPGAEEPPPDEEEPDDGRILPEAPPGPAEEPVDTLDEVLRDVIDESPVEPPDPPQGA